MSNSSSSDDNLALYTEAVEDLINLTAFPVMAETAIYSLQVVLTVYMLWRRWVDHKVTPATNTTLSVTLAMFLLYSTIWSVDIWTLTFAARDIFGLYDTSVSLYAINLTRQLCMAAILFIGDCVVLWRAYVIFERPRWLRITSIVVLLCTFAFYGWLSSKATDANLFTPVASIVPNIYATSLVTYKAWAHWKDIQDYSDRSSTRHSIVLLAIVVESGVIYLVLSIALIVSYPFSLAAEQWGSSILTPLTAMYPSLVVILVSTRRNLLERSIVDGRSTLPWAVDVPSDVSEDEEPHRRRGSARHDFGRNRFPLEGVPRLDNSFGPSMKLQDVVLVSKDGDAHAQVTEIPRISSSSSSSSTHSTPNEDMVTFSEAI
ncbi:hypothetical protein PENSPDRAFT_748148 [Peniophora sp. CONT]|nr:hypothetical protein PENSPDRAFT_748148 [Peniophora sp. CONT]